LDQFGVLIVESDASLRSATIVIDTEPEQVRVKAAVSSERVTHPDLLRQPFAITPAKAQALGLQVVESGFVATTPAPLARAQLRNLDLLQVELYGDADAFTPTNVNQVGVGLAYPNSPNVLPTGWIRFAVVSFALLLTLLIVAIGLSLSATESRDERDVLASIGAKPSAMRRVAGLKASWLALAGGVLAVPTGYLPVWAVLITNRTDMSVGAPFPWWIAGGVVIAIPLIAGLGAWLASSIAQAVRPVRMSTLSAD
jgi:hypothetical protein